MSVRTGVGEDERVCVCAQGLIMLVKMGVCALPVIVKLFKSKD